MTLAERIARAVRHTIDPIEEMPFLQDCSVDEVHPLVEEYLIAVEDQLHDVISRCGEMFLQALDAAGLCATCIAEGIDLPADTLLRTCQAIVNESVQMNEYVGDLPNGEPMYMVAIEI